MFLVYIGAQSTGIYYQRFVYGWMDLLSKAGGLIKGLDKTFMIVCLVLGQAAVNSKLVDMILGSMMDGQCCYKATLKKIEKI